MTSHHNNRLVFLVGFMGVGKTYIQRALTRDLGWEGVDLDHIIELRAGRSIASIFNESGESYFRELEHEVLKSIIREGGRKIIACGGGTPCFYDNMDIMNAAGLTIFISKDIDDILINVMRGLGKRPLLANKSKKEIKTYIFETLLERKPFYANAQRVIHGYQNEMLVEKTKEAIMSSFD